MFSADSRIRPSIFLSLLFVSAAIPCCSLFSSDDDFDYDAYYVEASTFENDSAVSLIRNVWKELSTVGAPTERSVHAAVWTGSKMIVWGGWNGEQTVADGGVYDPETDTWTSMSAPYSEPIARKDHSAVWTGTEMIVFSGKTGIEDSTMVPDGWAYNPSTDVWRRITAVGAPSPRDNHSAVWTGTEMIVFGGGGDDGFVKYDGGIYNPSSDSWSSLNVLNVPAGRYRHIAVWMGSQMFVWGGYGGGYLTTGAVFDRESRMWLWPGLRSTPPARGGTTAIFTGNETVMFGGYDGTNYLDDTWVYNNESRSWRQIDVGYTKPPKRTGHSAVWTGNKMLVFGGHDGIVKKDLWSFEPPWTIPPIWENFTVGGDAVNWISPPAEIAGQPYGVARVGFEGAFSGALSPGSDYKLALTVENSGDEDLYQVAAFPEVDFEGTSDDVTLPYRVFVGFVPRHGSVTRRVSFTLPMSFDADRIQFRLRFKEGRGFDPSDINVSQAVQPVPKPEIRYSARFIESVGNKDGILSPGESGDVVLGITNAGAGTARDLLIQTSFGAMSNYDGNAFLIGDTEETIPALGPNETHEFRVRLGSKPGLGFSSVWIHVFAQDRVFGLNFEDDIEIKVGARTSDREIVFTPPRTMYLAGESANVYSGASAETELMSIATGAGSALRITRQLGSWYEFESAEGKRAWIASNDLTEHGSQTVSSWGSQAVAPTITQVFRGEDVLRLNSPADSFVTTEEHVKVSGYAKAYGGFSQFDILVDGVVVSAISRDPGAIATADSGLTTPASEPARNFREEFFERTLSLSVGTHQIRVFLRTGNGKEYSETRTISRETPRGRWQVLCVGINDYRDDAIRDLQYAENDAIDVASWFETNPNSPLLREDGSLNGAVRTLTGSSATQGAISAAFEQHLVRGASAEEDTVVFFFAGHGIADERSTSLVAWDSQAAGLPATGVMAETLTGLWNRLRAKRRIQFIDACHAGGIGMFRGENQVNQSMRGVLGTVVNEATEVTATFGACQPGQFSHEDPEAENGVFTKILLDGLSGNADRLSGDGNNVVTLSELSLYLERNVQTRAQALGGSMLPSIELKPSGSVVIARVR
ncbi:MAG: caspase family protein [Planctomycetes bacterium]|nr:caspase family protein [Planctomycetota bacterium]